MYANTMSRVESGILVLTCGVDDVAFVLLALVLDLLGEGVLDSREVVRVEGTVDESDDEGRFPWGEG